MKNFIKKINSQAAYAVMVGGATGLVILVAWTVYEKVARIKNEKEVKLYLNA